MQKIDFNDSWYFRRGLENPMTLAFVGAGEKQETIKLPHDAMLDSARTAANSNEQGIGFYMPENVEYEKEYFALAENEGKVTYLDFDGVYGYTIVEINGNVAKRHKNGFAGFYVNISDYIDYGKNNKIKITVLNGMGQNGRYYTGTGIIRPVSIMVGETVHISPDGVRITTIDTHDKSATLDIAVDLVNFSQRRVKPVLKIDIFDAAGKIASSMTTVASLLSNEEITVRRRIYVEDPQLWSVDAPNLYTYKVSLESDGDSGKIVDIEEGSFGIRKLSLDPVKGFCINGLPVKLKGGCVHSDNGIIGAVSLPDAEERRITLLKNAGYNAIRTSHNPVSRAFLNACDKYGMLVMEEFADAWTHCKPTYDYSIWMEDCWEEDIESMVRTAYNHPSVVMYSIGNEISDVGSDISSRWGGKFIEKIKSLDPYRYITNGINVMMANLDKMGLVIEEEMAKLGFSGDEMTNGTHAGGDDINNLMDVFKPLMGKLMSHSGSLKAIAESCDMLDVAGYNYSAFLYELEHENHPHRICVGTETNPGELDANWELVEKLPYVIGDFAWTAWDYIGEPGIARIDMDADPAAYNVYADYPWVLAYCGDFDITGARRPMSYWREIVWGGGNHVPYISVHRPQNIGKSQKPSQWSWTDSLHSWTFPGYEGTKTIVEVYTDGDEVELILNGKSLGRKANNLEDKKYIVRWEVAYEPGRLEAIVYKDKKVIGTSTLATAEESHMCVSSSYDVINSDSNELIYVEIEYRDKNETLDMTKDTKVEIQVSDNLELLGCGSADPKSEECYRTNVHQIFEGRIAAVARAKKLTDSEPAEDAWIRISDDRGEDKEIIIKVIN